MDLRVDAPDALETADVDFSDGHLWDVFRSCGDAAGPGPHQRPLRGRRDRHDRVGPRARAGLEGLPAWNAARPGASEAIAIQTVAYLSRRFNVPVYFPHIGSREAIEALVDVRAKGTNYGAEVGPQYVALTTVSRAGPLAKVMPPGPHSRGCRSRLVGHPRGRADLVRIGPHRLHPRGEESPGSIWTTRPAFGGTGMILPIFLQRGGQRRGG